MPLLHSICLAACLVVLSGGAAQAAPKPYDATLSGVAEVPPNASPATGDAGILYDPATHTLEVAAEFSGLNGNTTAAHIHCCAPPGVNAGVATQTPTFVGFPLGVTSGVYVHTFDMTLASSYNATFITNNGGTVASAEAALAAGFEAGTTYFNLHSSVFPGGEIRGQLRSPFVFADGFEGGG